MHGLVRTRDRQCRTQENADPPWAGAYLERVEANLGKVDVAIVGGGVVGVACALELARRGAEVRVLERGRLGHGCSYGNAGWLTASLALPLAAPGQTLKALGWLFDRESPFYIRPRFDPALASWLLRFLANSRPAPFERGARALIELSRWSVDFWEQLERRAPGSFGFERDAEPGRQLRPASSRGQRFLGLVHRKQTVALETERLGCPPFEPLPEINAPAAQLDQGPRAALERRRPAIRQKP